MVVTFDFDHTLKFEHGGPNLKTINEFKRLQKDNEIFIVTTRAGFDEQIIEIRNFLEEFDLNPIDIIFTEGKPKIEFLKKLNSSWHFDDCNEDLQDAKNNGIKITECFSEDDWYKYMGIL